MNKKRLGCLTAGGLISLVITFISVGTSYALTKNQMFSPGDLGSFSTDRQIGGVDSHADLGNNCQACHPAPWDADDMADLCLTCHTNIQTQMTDTHSLHGAVLQGVSTQDCRVCHTDHLGRSGALTSYKGDNFPHDLVSFSLLSHQELDWSREIICQDCHPTSYRNFDPVLCSDCHFQVDQTYTDRHIAAFDITCTNCHDGVESFNHSYDHSQAGLPLEGKHLEIDCEDCHYGSKNPDMFNSAPDACFSCHLAQDAHQGSLGLMCEDCHTPQAWSPAIFDHVLTGFALDGAHLELDCRDCHADLTFQEVDPACVSCHLEDDPHQSQLGPDCTLCHTTISWSDVNFDHEGPFAENCSTCHQDDSPANHYPGQCSACHTISGWLPASFNHAVAQASDCQSCHLPDKPANHYSGQCSICHSTSRWKPANINHTFPITHEGAGGVCTKCHTPNNYYAYTCYLCHEHSRSEVKKEHEGISNLDNCIRCHWDGRKHEDGGGGDDD